MWARLRLRRPAIGLDIGSTAVRAVVLSRYRRRWSLDGCGEVDLATALGDDRGAGEWQLSDAVCRLLEPLDPTHSRVIAAMDAQTVIVKRLTFPAMRRRELRRAIRWEAQPHVPFDLDDAHVDCHVLAHDSRRPAVSVDVLLVAARKSDIEARALLVRRTGLALAALDVEAFALVNAYALNYPERSDPRTLIVHVARSVAVVCLLAHGQMIFTRDVLVSGRDLALEVRTAVRFHHTADTGTTITRVVVSGEACTSDGVIDSLESELRAPVEIFDPFRSLIRRPSGDGGTAQETGDPSYAIAVGLAIHGKVPR